MSGPRGRGVLWTIAAFFSALLVTIGSPATAVETAPGDPEPTDVAVVITAITPTVLTPGAELTVSATITNTTDQPLEGAVARLRVTQLPMQTRSQVWTWSDNDPTTPGLAGSIMVPIELTTPIAPGASQALTFVLPPDSINRGQRYWGPHALAVEVILGNVRIGIARSFTLWDEGSTYQPTKVSLLMPIRVPAPVVTTPVELAPTPPDEVATVSPDVADAIGTLTTLAGHTAVTLLVDPSALTTGPLADTPVGEELLGAMSQRETFLAPAGDLDVAALAHAGSLDWVKSGLESATTAWLQLKLGGNGQHLLAPPFGLQDTTVLAELAADGLRLVAAPGELTPDEDLVYTPNSAVNTHGTRVLVPDEVLSTYFSAPTLPPAQQAMLLAAETMVITGERPSDSRHILVTTPSDWRPTVTTATATMQILNRLPWVTMAPLTDLLSTTPDLSQRTALPSHAPGEHELDPAVLAQLAHARTLVADLASATVNPAGFREQFENRLRQVLSVSARLNPTSRQILIEELLAAGDSASGVVTLLPGSGITQLSADAELPVVIANDAPFPLTLTVELVPDSDRIRADQNVVVTVSAQSQYTVRVPVHVSANGEYEIGVNLLAPNGSILAQGEPIVLNVQAQWDIIITAIVAVGAVIVLFFGLWRTVRSRRGTRAEQIAASQAQEGTVIASDVERT